MNDEAELKAEIAAYNAERNEMLIAGDVDRLLAFNTKHGLPQPSNRAVAEITIHKARTGVTALPRELRAASYRWLKERGHTTWDDGDLSS